MLADAAGEGLTSDQTITQNAEQMDPAVREEYFKSLAEEQMTPIEVAMTDARLSDKEENDKLMGINGLYRKLKGLDTHEQDYALFTDKLLKTAREQMESLTIQEEDLQRYEDKYPDSLKTYREQQRLMEEHIAAAESATEIEVVNQELGKALEAGRYLEQYQMHNPSLRDQEYRDKP